MAPYICILLIFINISIGNLQQRFEKLYRWSVVDIVDSSNLFQCWVNINVKHMMNPTWRKRMKI